MTVVCFQVFYPTLERGGYKNPDNPAHNERLIEFINKFWKAEQIIDLHTSGHADKQTLRDICEMANPHTAIIPIHRDAKSDIKDILDSPLKEKVVTESTMVGGIEIEIM